MTSELYLSESDTSPLKPYEHEPNSRNVAGISPFAVPEGLICSKDELGFIVRMRFVYAGGETVHLEEVLDEIVHPCVNLGISKASRKIMEMHFQPGADSESLHRIAGRLSMRAAAVSPRAKKFSYRMVAEILRHFAHEIYAAEGDEAL